MLTGRELLANRYRNKGTAFTADERVRFRLNGLLPPLLTDAAIVAAVGERRWVAEYLPTDG